MGKKLYARMFTTHSSFDVCSWTVGLIWRSIRTRVLLNRWLWVKTNGIPFSGRFITQWPCIFFGKEFDFAHGFIAFRHSRRVLGSSKWASQVRSVPANGLQQVLPCSLAQPPGRAPPRVFWPQSPAHCHIPFGGYVSSWQRIPFGLPTEIRNHTSNLERLPRRGRHPKTKTTAN